LATFKLGSLFYCLVLDTIPLPKNIMNNISPYEYLLGFATFGTLISAIDMIDTLRVFILVLTALGTLIKFIEQVNKSKESIKGVICYIKELPNLWKKKEK
jgi:hypothetical protein